MRCVCVCVCGGGGGGGGDGYTGDSFFNMHQPVTRSLFEALG